VDVPFSEFGVTMGAKEQKIKPEEAHCKTFAGHKNYLAGHMWPAGR
jgi:hypothetical protein